MKVQCTSLRFVSDLVGRPQRFLDHKTKIFGGGGGGEKPQLLKVLGLFGEIPPLFFLGGFFLKAQKRGGGGGVGGKKKNLLG